MIGHDAALDESGFQEVAVSCCHEDMKAFISRAIDDLNLKVCDEGGLSGVVPFYACPEATVTYSALQAELSGATASGGTCHWLAPVADACTPPAAECAVTISQPGAEPAVTGFLGLTASNPLELVRTSGVADAVKSELASALEVSLDNVNVVIATSTMGLSLLQGRSVFTSLRTGQARPHRGHGCLCLCVCAYSCQHTEYTGRSVPV